MTPARKKPRLRVTGAVRAMNQARQALSLGLLPEEVEAFRSLVRGTLAGLEAICREHRITPQELPAPTRKAYLYLRSIDLKRLPLRSPEAGPAAPPPEEPKKAVTAPGLLAFCEVMQDKFWALAEESDPQAEEKASGDIRQALQRVAGASERSDGLSPADLAPPSRRAYAWLKFLAEPAHFQQHLQAVRTARRAAEKAACRKGLPPARRKLPVHVSFFNTASLFRARTLKDGVHLTASEAFIEAGPEVLEALICAALGAGGETASKAVRAYAESEPFARLLRELDLPEADDAARGRYYDLRAVFERVNREYFQDRIERPRLVWNSTLTRRKLGHYQPASDTVMISITLDQPGIPEAVIDFVMFHELLHKDLGMPLVNGRRRVHSPAFRQAERKFRQYSEVQEFLKKI